MKYAVRLLLAVVLAACSHANTKRENRWESEGYLLEMKNVPESDITAWTFESSVDAPPWRLWNAINDLDAIFDLVPRWKLLGKPTTPAPGRVRMNVTLKPVWYAPSVTATIEGQQVKGELAWDAQCVGAWSPECYMRFSVVPMNEGKTSMLRVTGYFVRPWYVTYYMTNRFYLDNTSEYQASIGYRVQLPKYGVPDASYPWVDLAQLSVAPVERSEEHDAAKPRLAVHSVEGFGLGNTDAVLVSLASDYLAYAITRGDRFAVSTPEDLKLLAKYMGENWAFICQNDDCRARLARSADVDYLISGTLRADAERHAALSLVLLDPKKGHELWRWQQSVDPTTDGLKRSIDAAVANMNGIALH